MPRVIHSYLLLVILPKPAARAIYLPWIVEGIGMKKPVPDRLSYREALGLAVGRAISIILAAALAVWLAWLALTWLFAILLGALF